jgi:hypothetical protein
MRSQARLGLARFWECSLLGARQWGELICLSDYRKTKENQEQYFYMEVIPPVMIIRYSKQDIVQEQHVISERMLREILDRSEC